MDTLDTIVLILYLGHIVMPVGVATVWYLSKRTEAYDIARTRYALLLKLTRGKRPWK
jgi:hypothetical protein